MKKLVLFILVLTLAGSLFAYNDLMVQTENKTAKDIKGLLIQTQTREVPEVEFEIEPIDLATTFYDYMMGSYCSLPLRILESGDAYAAFHARETSLVNRRVYYSFIEQGGDNSTMTIGTADEWEGYAGIDIDPVTSDPFVAWHVDVDAATAGLEVVVSYDMYHVQGAGYWKAPFVVINSDIPSPYDDDEFIWPYIYIGNSPVDGKRRVFVTANNSVGHGPAANPAENVMIAYADFNGNDILSQSELEWSYTSIALFDGYNAGDPELRPFKAMTTSDVDGRVAYMGFNTADEAFVVYNDNYGEGEWTTVLQDFHNSVTLPTNEDGSDTFGLTDGFFSNINDGHFNIIFTDNGKLVHSGSMGLQGNDSETGEAVYIPYAIYPYTFIFDFDTEEISFQVVNPQINENAANPEYVWTTNQAYLPWDTDNDGEVDEYDDEGYAQWFSGWPVYFHDNDTAFHENGFYTVTTGNRMVNVWMDGLNNKYAQDGIEGYEDWIEVAEIAIAISNDNGVTWSEAIMLNNLETDELDGMKPAYVYPGDVIEDLGDDIGRLHLMFLDDNSFGSSIHNFGNADGGTIKYAALNIDFNYGDTSTDGSETAPVMEMLSQNYPNPFNPTTTISYTIQSAGNVTVDVYNTKGQVVNTLLNETQAAGTHNVVWNGTDSRGDGLTSGVYFYKIRSGKFTSTKKMILLK